MIINETSRKKVLPVASGKGGVGKSVFVANLGISLASFGQQTVLIDLDLGGSNLHTYLGLKNRNRGIGNFISDKSVSFDEIMVRTPYPNLRFIPGDVLVAGSANLTYAQKRSIISNINKIDADYVLVDLGSGSHFTTIDFFLTSNSGIIVTTPQAPAILNAYGFLKNAVFRMLQQTFSRNKRVANYLTSVLKETRPNATPSIAAIVEKITKLSKRAGTEAREQIAQLRPSVVVSMADRPDDMEIVQSLRSLIETNLELEVICLGLLYYDQTVHEAVLENVPLAMVGQQSLILREIDRIAQKLVHSERFPEMPLDLDEYEDSFGLAQIEADDDYAAVVPRSRGPQPSEGDQEDTQKLIELIAAQKQKIDELQGTVRMLTMQQDGPPLR